MSTSSQCLVTKLVLQSGKSCTHNLSIVTALLLGKSVDQLI